MAEGLIITGVLSKEELSRLPGMPSEERLKEGAVVVIECAEEIPCNPCESACRQGAIMIGENINAIPALTGDLCTACGLCIAACPGQAIFIVDMTYSDTEAVVQLPYEFLPLPGRGATVKCLNRQGEVVSSGRVVKVVNPKSYDRTPVVWVAVPKELAMEVRAIRL